MAKRMIFGRYAEWLKTLDDETRSRVLVRNVSRSYDSELEVKICRSRKSAARQVRKIEQKPHDSTAWRAVVKLKETEGFN